MAAHGHDGRLARCAANRAARSTASIVRRRPRCVRACRPSRCRRAAGRARGRRPRRTRRNWPPSRRERDRAPCPAPAWRALLVSASCTRRTTVSARPGPSTRTSPSMSSCSVGLGNGAASARSSRAEIEAALVAHGLHHAADVGRAIRSTAAAPTRSPGVRHRRDRRRARAGSTSCAVSLWPATSCSSRATRSRSASRAVSASNARVASRSALTRASASRERSALMAYHAQSAANAWKPAWSSDQRERRFATALPGISTSRRQPPAPPPGDARRPCPASTAVHTTSSTGAMPGRGSSQISVSAISGSRTSGRRSQVRRGEMSLTNSSAREHDQQREGPTAGGRRAPSASPAHRDQGEQAGEVQRL